MFESLFAFFVGVVWSQVHEAVIAAGKTRSGCTVHQVTEEVDSGPVVVQEEVEVVEGETPESLKEKVRYGQLRLDFDFSRSVSPPVCVLHLLSAKGSAAALTLLKRT